MAIIGHGSKLVIVGPVGGDALVLSVACLSIDPGSNKIDAPDTTDMLTAGQTRVFTPGLENPGDVTIKYNSNPVDTGQAGLIAAKGIPYLFYIEYPGAVWYEYFEGIVVSVDESVPDDKPITRTAKIQKSGPTTQSATAPTVTVGTIPSVLPAAQSSGYSS